MLMSDQAEAGLDMPQNPDQVGTLPQIISKNGILTSELDRVARKERWKKAIKKIIKLHKFRLIGMIFSVIFTQVCGT